MRIIFLNTWYGKTGKVFFDYIKEVSQSTDIFALTEVPSELFSDLKLILEDFNGFYDEGMFDKNMNTVYGQAIFVSKKYKSKPLERIYTFKNTSTDVGYGSLQIISRGKKSFYLVNIHGKAQPGSKFDTPVRIKQSENVISAMKGVLHPIIIGGDFNLNPDTKSIKMFEEVGYRNLVKEFGIKSTRNKVSWLNFADHPGFVKQYYADYVFTSSEVKVDDFKAPYNEVSDHLPLVLDFEI